MGRRGGGGGMRSRPRRRVTSNSTTRKKSTSTKKEQPKQQQQQQQAAPQQGGSMLGGFVGNALSFAAGSVIGHGISKMIWGNEAEGKSEEELQQMSEELERSCTNEYKNFQDCLEAYSDNIEKCQFWYSELQQCHKQATAEGF